MKFQRGSSRRAKEGARPLRPPLLKFQRGSSNGTAAAPPFPQILDPPLIDLARRTSIHIGGLSVRRPIYTYLSTSDTAGRETNDNNIWRIEGPIRRRFLEIKCNNHKPNIYPKVYRLLHKTLRIQFTISLDNGYIIGTAKEQVYYKCYSIRSGKQGDSNCHNLYHNVKDRLHCTRRNLWDKYTNKSGQLYGEIPPSSHCYSNVIPKVSPCFFTP